MRFLRIYQSIVHIHQASITTDSIGFSFNLSDSTSIEYISFTNTHTDYNKLWKLIISTLEGAYFLHSLHILIDQKWHGTLFLSFFSIKIAFTWAKTFHYFFSYIDRIEFVQLRFISIEMSLFLSLYPSLFSTIHSTDAS